MVKRLSMMIAGLLLCGAVMAQSQVSGTVVDDTGEPVAGASVMVEGTKTGTVTDVDGHFTLSAPAGSRLSISYLGMKPQTVKAGSNMHVTMASDDQTLDEVMVVAYGTQKKSSFTGSAAVVDSKQLDVHNVSNVSRALDGQMPGVTVTSGDGQPGSGSSIIVRGFGSINASSTPLYVVDGIPYDGNISAINPADIAQVTVLKDASAGALYGARGANGVVMITTKKGEAGRPRVTLRNTVGWSHRALPRYQNVGQSDFVQLSYEALRNSYEFTNGMSHADAAAAARANLGAQLGGEQYNPFKNYTFDTIIDPATEQVRPDAKSAWNEDWMDELMRSAAPRHEHELTVSGGSETTQYLVSLGYVNEQGILKNTDFQRYSGRANVDSQVKDWFKVGLNTSLSYVKSKYNQFNDGSSAQSNVFYSAQFVSPLYPMYIKNLDGTDALDAEGRRQYDYGEQGRPSLQDFNMLAGLYDDKSYETYDNASVRTYLQFGSDKDSYGWAKGLKFTINFGADYRSNEATEVYNKYHGNQATAGGMIEKGHSRLMSFTLNELLTWQRSFGLHNFDVLLGHEYYQRNYSYLMAGKSNIVDGIDELAPAAKLQEGTSYSTKYDVESWLGRFNYNYDDKYYFSASFRRDGSSRFFKDNRWGTFWSVGANWRISQEKFMQNVNWVDNLSFKISYGEQGNDAILDALGAQEYYVWQNLYDLSYSNGSAIGGLVSSLENKDISWEKNGNLNIGLEGTLFDQILQFSVEYYNRKTTDMLLNYPMALSTGFSGFNANVGDMRNTGWEFMLGVTPVKTSNVVWNVRWIGSTLSNKVLHLTDQSNQIVSGTRIIKEGMPINTFYMAKAAGVDPQTGAQLYYAYESMNDDGSVNGEYITSDYQKAATSKYYLGSRIPDLYGSISTTLTLFKNIDFSLMTTYSIGGKILDALYEGSMNNLYYNNNWNKNELRRWQKPGDITDVPRVEVGGHYTITDNYLINASYFAIKNITVGYTFPKAWTSKLTLSGVRLYFSAENLALWSHLKGMDPQYNFSGSTGYTYSPNKTYTLGLDINF